MNINKDYYKILGVDSSASTEEIKSAYRKLALKYHPDRNPGNKEYEELFKEINEGYEILEKDSSRFVYDEYRKEKFTRTADTHSFKATYSTQTAQRKSAEYTRKKKIKKPLTKERRVYLRGEIIVKFYGEQLNELSENIFKESFYKIYAADTLIIIHEENIFPVMSEPHQHKKVYAETDLFKTPLKQPLKCQLQTTGGTVYYKLHINDIRVVDPVIYDITKTDGETYGTLKGELYGYVQHFETEEIEEEVTECFGETGKTETKVEEDIKYFRKEFYYQDCSAFWGPWERESKPVNASKESESAVAGMQDALSGCLPLFPALLLAIILFFLAPQVALPILLIVAVLLLIFFLQRG